MDVLGHNTMHADSDEQQVSDTSNSRPSSLPAPSTIPSTIACIGQAHFHLNLIPVYKSLTQ